MANNMLLSRVRLFSFVILTTCFLSGTACNLLRIRDKNYPPTTIADDLKYLPNGTFLQGAALSFDEILADIIWIKAVTYVGKHSKTDQDFTWLYHILDIVTTLDPLYSDPYEFGGVILSNEIREVDNSLALLKKGMTNVPKNHKRYWYLPFYSAFNYMFYKKDNLTAALLLEEAAQLPHRPEYLPLLVSRLYANTNDPALAIPFLTKMFENTPSQTMKEKLAVRINQIQQKQNILELTKAFNLYKNDSGIFPTSLNELIRQGFIEKIPQDPFDGEYYISQKNHTIMVTNEADSLNLHIKISTPVPTIFLKNK